MQILRDNEQAKYEFFYNKMLEHKENCLKKLSFISDEYDIQNKFAKLLIDAECEGCIYAEDFISYFDLDEIDRYAIIEDVERFTELFIEENENKFCEENYV